MNLVSISGLSAFVFIGMLGVAGGTSLASKMVGLEAAQAVLYYGGGWVCFGSAILVILLIKARRRAIAHQLFIGLGVNVGAASLLLGISAPILWLGVKFPLVGITILVFLFLFLIYQIHQAYASFNECWERNHKIVLAASYSAEQSVIDADNLLRQLGVQADLILPTKSEILCVIVKASLVVSMLAGFSLRSLFPQLSVIAWGVPALVLATVAVQMGFLRLLIAVKIYGLEKVSNRTIAPMDDVDFSKARTSRKRLRAPNKTYSRRQSNKDVR